ncbi:zinc metalloproteinase-like protein isoform X2 [Tasmannia lanceolata]|uniref:zinc metalloproteinase-like protein isoform X2 n=1 Tax=Tasmannia lanceolata TaxID=3420 RepID=UPI00406392E5
MEEQSNMINLLVIWRGKQLNVEINSNSTIKDFGNKLQKLTNVKPDTMRLLLPRSTSTSSKTLAPFLEEHSSLGLQEISVLKLNPPPSEALRRMHMLACDPGIIAIMNKHRWRVGIMTEMPPVGYVGVSPKCILGFNKNNGEEISLRLRTDDLKGFRKYESIKKTLLHELAHMVYSEHDANFFALDKQLNQEAASLDWTKSKGHTLSGLRHSDRYEEEFHSDTNSSYRKLGGKSLSSLPNARASSVAAAYHRVLNASAISSEALGGKSENEQTDGLSIKVHHEPNAAIEPDPDDCLDGEKISEPDPDDCLVNGNMLEPYSETSGDKAFGLDPNDCEAIVDITGAHLINTGKVLSSKYFDEPDPDDSETNKVVKKYGIVAEPNPDDSQAVEAMKDEAEPELSRRLFPKKMEESDPSDSETKEAILGYGDEPDPDDSQADDIMQAEPDHERTGMQTDEPDPDDMADNQELQRIDDPVTVICTRLRKAIEMLRSEATPVEVTSVTRTLFKIIKNVIEHPDDMKYRRLRKANPQFQLNVANYKAAMEVLSVVGFHEDVVSDAIGRSESYLVLKRDDPGLLWLAKSSLEMCIA